MRLLKRIHPVDIAAIIFCLLFIATGILINLNRFWQFELGYYDFGIFDRPIWLISQFKAPIIDHFLVGGKINLADHFNPGIYLLAPLYWFTSRSEIILIIPSIAVGISGFILYSIGKKLLKSHFAPLSVMVAYYLFLGTQNAIYSDFHAVTISALTIALTYWAAVTKSKKLFLVFLVLTLSLKENLVLFGISVALFIWVYNNWKKYAIYTLIGSIVYGLVLIKIVMPFFAGQPYIYTTPHSLNAQQIITALFMQLIKVKTVFLTFLSFLFLPLFYLPLLPHIALNFISRFIPEGGTRWDLGLHYNAEIAPTLAIASLFTLKTIKEKYGKLLVQYIAGALFLWGILFNLFYFKGPFLLAIHPVFYEHTNVFGFLRTLVSKVPKNATVAAQNNLASYFLHNNNVWILRENYKIHKPDYIVIDAREGQNPSNFLGIEDIRMLLKSIKKDPDYSIYFRETDQYIFKRTVKRD